MKLRFLPGLLLALLSVCNQLSWAQGNQPGLTSQLTSVLTPTPTAASLGKFFELPVSTYTGIPTINVPIWQLQQGDISVDIGLSYHGGGIKVDEAASWVGLGWALRSGGMITRTTRGLPDDIQRYRAFDLPRINSFINHTLTAKEIKTFLLGVYKGDYDAEPDLYSLSVNGIACQFYMGADGEFITMPRDLNLRIQYEATDAKGTQYTWLITDGKGIQYKFLDAEHSTTYHYGGSVGGQVSDTGYFDGDTSWGLREITDTKGNAVQFSYIAEGSTLSNISGEQVVVSTSLSTDCFGKGSQSYSYSISQGRALRLSTITCGQEEVRFVANPDERKDLLYGHSLQRVEVRYAGEVKRVFRLFTSDVAGTDIGTHGVYYPDRQNASRLFLDSVREESADGRLRLPAYRFTYHSGSLPYRGSAAQDHWGYYNGQDNRTRVTYKTSDAYPAQGANKNPNPAFSIGGTLTSIQYPTGGSIDFIYEANTYPNSIEETTKDTVIVALSGNNYTPTDYEVDFYFEQAFTIPSKIVGPDGTLRLKPIVTKIDNNNNGGIITYFIENAVTHERISFSDQGTTIIYDPVEKRYKIVPVYLKAGDYILKGQIQTEFPNNPYLYFSVIVQVAAYHPPTTLAVVGPGLRIKQITKHFVNSVDQQQFFDYNNPTTGITSGVLGNRPDYHTAKTYHYRNELGGNASYTYTCECQEYTSGSHYPLISSKGSYIGYSYVTEYTNAAHSQGKLTHTYTNFDLFNDINNTTNFPYSPSASQDWKRGLPLVEQKWSSLPGTGNRFERQQKDSLSYTTLIPSIKWTYGIRTGNVRNCVESGQGWGDFLITDDDFATMLLVDQYPLESDSHQLQTKTTTLFSNVQPWTTNATYSYTPDTYQLRRVVSTNSNGVTTAQRYMYPTDYATKANQSPILAGLLAAHRLTIPLEQTKVQLGVGAKLLNGIAYEYGQLTDASGIQRTFLKRIYTANTAKADTASRYDMVQLPAYYEEAARVKRINGRGQPVLQTEKSGLSNAYRWGYDERYVIAACLNATDNEFFYEGFETDAAATSGTAQAGTHYKSGTYTVSWTAPNSRGYMLGYWARQAGNWRYQQRPYTGTSAVLTGGDAYDEVRICPADANLTTYTYDPLVGMTSQTGPNGRTTTYEYDGLGRLVRTRDEQGRILSQQQYHYAGN